MSPPDSLRTRRLLVAVWCGVVWFERYGYVSTERSVVCVLVGVVGLVGGLHVSTEDVHDGVLDGVLVLP